MSAHQYHSSMRIHTIVAVLLNLAAIGMLIYKVWTGNDKAPILLLTLYPLLLLLNLITWLALKAMRRQEAAIYRITTQLLTLLFIPVVWVSTLF